MKAQDLLVGFSFSLSLALALSRSFFFDLTTWKPVRPKKKTEQNVPKYGVSKITVQFNSSMWLLVTVVKWPLGASRCREEWDGIKCLFQERDQTGRHKQALVLFHYPNKDLCSSPFLNKTEIKMLSLILLLLPSSLPALLWIPSETHFHVSLVHGANKLRLEWVSSCVNHLHSRADYTAPFSRITRWNKSQSVQR